MHVTGAFLLAGYRHVVGSLWPIDDRTAARLTDAVYSRLTDGGREAPQTDRTAHAVHEAVLALRAADPGAPQRWAGLLHTGA